MPKTSFFRRKPAFFGLCLTLLLCTLWGTIWYTQPANQYKRAAKQLFIDEMTASTLNMHYTLASPKDYGISRYKAILPCYDSNKRQAGIVSLEESLDFYQSLNLSKLKSPDAHSVNLLTVYLENNLALSKIFTKLYTLNQKQYDLCTPKNELSS